MIRARRTPHTDRSRTESLKITANSWYRVLIAKRTLRYWVELTRRTTTTQPNDRRQGKHHHRHPLVLCLFSFVIHSSRGWPYLFIAWFWAPPVLVNQSIDPIDSIPAHAAPLLLQLIHFIHSPATSVLFVNRGDPVAPSFAFVPTSVLLAGLSLLLTQCPSLRT